MKYKLAIFDMDGTILNTLEDLKNSLNYSLAALGFPERSLKEVRRFVGNGVRRLVERGVPENTSKELADQVYLLFEEHYAIHCSDNTRPYPGIVETIQKLRSLGYLTAVVSNKADFAVQPLCVQFFPNLFDAAFGSSDDIQKKPAPDAVNAVLDKLHIRNKEAVYIGDSEVDLQTAINSNMDCICVDWGYRDHDQLISYGAKQIVSTPNELSLLLSQE